MFKQLHKTKTRSAAVAATVSLLVALSVAVLTPVQVFAALPVARLSATPMTVCRGQDAVTLSGTTSSDPDGSVVAYWFSYGDGFDSGWTSNATASYIYSSNITPGVYYAKLKVKDNVGNMSPWSAAVAITVSSNCTSPGTPPSVPVARLSATPTTVCRGQDAVTFSGAASSAPSGSVVAYWFDYGDGFDSGWTSNATAGYTYASNIAPGTYSAKLKVKDSAGNVSSWSDAVAVTVSSNCLSPGTPPTLPPTLTAAISGPSSVNAGWTFSGTFQVSNSGSTAYCVSMSVATPSDFSITENAAYVSTLDSSQSKTLGFSAVAPSYATQGQFIGTVKWFASANCAGTPSLVQGFLSVTVPTPKNWALVVVAVPKGPAAGPATFTLKDGNGGIYATRVVPPADSFVVVFTVSGPGYYTAQVELLEQIMLIDVPQRAQKQVYVSRSAQYVYLYP